MASIWFKNPTVEQMNERSRDTLLERLDIRFTEIGENFIRATMPVDGRTVQPMRILHGGASVALAESLASTGGNLVVDYGKFHCVGLEINANHVRSAKSGLVTGTSTPLHLGRKTQVWETKIEQDGQLVCVSRMTLAVIEK